MAAVTIRNLSDGVVEALKKRAKRNGRSMEAEIREALIRLAADDDLGSGLEERMRSEVPVHRWSVPGSEIRARIAANPPTDEQLRVAREWAEEYAARPYDEDPFRDPWERAGQLRDDARKAQKSE